MRIAIITINTIVDVFTAIIFIYTLLGFFLGRSNSIQRTLGGIVEPLLAPIRKWVPSVGGLDFSPMILMILIQVIGMILVAILRSIA